MSFAPPLPRPLSILDTINDLEPRPAFDDRLKDYKHIDHTVYREKCNDERTTYICYDVEKNADADLLYIDDNYINDDYNAWLKWAEISPSFRVRLKKMATIFPYRDPIYLVAIVFLLGSVDLVINAFFDLLSRTIPSTRFETEETVAVPSTVLIGSILFFAAGIFDTFGALNADCGTLETSKEVGGQEEVTYRPALLGSPEFRWLPPRAKIIELTTKNLAFQAGLIVLFGGIVFMFAGIVDFPGLIPEEGNPFFASIVFGPQIIHGVLFFVANIMLAIYEQERWYIPKLWDADWASAALNAVGGLNFMLAGLLLFGKKTGEEEDVRAAIAAMVGSWAFFTGSLVRWYVVMEFW
jgi:hypothetical protein